MKQSNSQNDEREKQEKWFYSDIVKEHFFKPRNFIDAKEVENYEADGIGIVGNAKCGDVMKVLIKVDDTSGKIREMKWMTFGCASAIASTSMLSVMVTENNGMKIKDALKIKPQQILERLGGLPMIKVHCSVLGDRALRSAIDDYLKKKKSKKEDKGEKNEN